MQPRLASLILSIAACCGFAAAVPAATQVSTAQAPLEARGDYGTLTVAVGTRTARATLSTHCLETPEGSGCADYRHDDDPPVRLEIRPGSPLLLLTGAPALLVKVFVEEPTRRVVYYGRARRLDGARRRWRFTLAKRLRRGRALDVLVVYTGKIGYAHFVLGVRLAQPSG